MGPAGDLVDVVDVVDVVYTGYPERKRTNRSVTVSKQLIWFSRYKKLIKVIPVGFARELVV